MIEALAAAAEVGSEVAAEVETMSEVASEVKMSFKDAVEYWNKDFSMNSEFGGRYNSYADRIDHTLKDKTKFGEYEGERGESKFTPSEETEAGCKAKEKLAEYDMDGVEYKNAEPDFSKCSEATVEIDDMTSNRPYNYSQADAKCAEQWNKEAKDNRTDWTDEDVANYRSENKLSWHERCDLKSMDLVHQDIHDFFKHLGGVSECKIKEAMESGMNNMIGGGFDE